MRVYTVLSSTLLVHNNCGVIKKSISSCSGFELRMEESWFIVICQWFVTVHDCCTLHVSLFLCCTWPVTDVYCRCWCTVVCFRDMGMTSYTRPVVSIRRHIQAVHVVVELVPTGSVLWQRLHLSGFTLTLLMTFIPVPAARPFDGVTLINLLL